VPSGSAAPIVAGENVAPVALPVSNQAETVRLTRTTKSIWPKCTALSLGDVGVPKAIGSLSGSTGWGCPWLSMPPAENARKYGRAELLTASAICVPFTPIARGKTWVETDVEELLGLTAEEMLIVEFRAALAVALQQARKRRKLTQEQAAEMIGTSQAQVSKMEAGRSSITIDRLIKALASLGLSRPAIIKALNDAA